MNVIIRKLFLMQIICCLTALQVNFSNAEIVLASASNESQPSSASSQDALLLKAAAEDDLPAIKKLISLKGINLDVTDKAGLTPLMHAIINRDTEAARMLMDAGAHVDQADKAGNTPWMAAILTDNLNMQVALFSKKAWKGAKNNQGLTAQDLKIQKASYRQSRRNASTVDSFSGMSADGAIVDYAQYRGKKALLVFFFLMNSWDGKPVNVEPQARVLGDISKTYGSEKIGILAVNCSKDSFGLVKAYGAKMAWPFPVVYDPFSRIYDTFTPPSLPYFVLIDSQGNIVYRGGNPPEDIKIRQCVNQEK